MSRRILGCLRVPVVLVMLVFASGQPTGAALAEEAGKAARNAIRDRLTGWMEDFNAGRPERLCDLFSRDLRYDFRGFPERGYQEICTLLKTSLGDQSRHFSYDLDIKEILIEGDLAIVRLVWSLRVMRDGVLLEEAQELGMDVFRREADGRWRIVRYMAYTE